MDASYYGCLIILNLLFLCKYEYFKGEEKLMELFEEVITILVYVMVSILVIKLIC